MTEKQELERKILLKQQIILQFKLGDYYIEGQRAQIRTMRRRLWEIEEGKCLNLRRAA